MKTYKRRGVRGNNQDWVCVVPPFEVDIPENSSEGYEHYWTLANRKVTLERLQTAHDHFMQQPAHAVDMELWHTRCGTALCFVGHATNIPKFQELGFKFDKAASLLNSRSDVRSPIFGNRWGVDAVSGFFQISEPEFMYLFHEKSYARPTKYYVARRVQDAINRLKRNIEKTELK